MKVLLVLYVVCLVLILDWVLWQVLVMTPLVVFRLSAPRVMQQPLAWHSYLFPPADGRKFGYYVKQDPNTRRTEVMFGYWRDYSGCSRYLTRAAAERAAVAMMMGGEL